MRQFDENKKMLLAAKCNCCGRSLRVENGVLKEGCFIGRHDFGYFSAMDGERHSFDLCEACYRKMTEGFVIPVEKENLTELL